MRGEVRPWYEVMNYEPDSRRRRPGKKKKEGGGNSGEPIFGSDDWLAAELSKRLGEDWRHAGGNWYRWNGQRWEPEKTKLVWDISRHVCRELADRIDEPGLARRASSAPAIYRAVQLAEADRRHATLITAFDADPWSLNTPEGIVDLRTGEVGLHRREALMSKIATAGPVGDCPLFRRYLDEVTGGDKELQNYLQCVAGYCLTGDISEHCILFFHGPGGGGKTTFLLVIQDLLGDYAVNSPMDTFTVAMGERHPTELAHFTGARVVTASEVEEGMRWDEAKLKAISGGDRITARFMRGDFFTFYPQFKLLLAGNHRPRMRSADDAMRRRMQVIPFRHKPRKIDKDLREKLKGELGGILRWALEGEAERRHLGGLNPPQAVIYATNEYFEAENTIGRWVDGRCEIGVDYWAETTDELYPDYVSWAKRVGEFVLSERVFSQKLEQISGVKKAKHPRSRRSGFAGLRLRGGTDDLFRQTQGPFPANEWPREPADDPAEKWPR
jgi:putative DNA primase/helicase